MTQRTMASLMSLLAVLTAACTDGSTAPAGMLGGSATPARPSPQTAGAPARAPSLPVGGGTSATPAPPGSAPAAPAPAAMPQSPALPAATGPQPAGAAPPPMAGAPALPADSRIDPGTGPWEPVPDDQVGTVCKLDRQELLKAAPPEGASFGVIRYGRHCYMSGERGADGPRASPTFSVTKTLGALLTGTIMYQTRDRPQRGARKQGPLLELDRVDKWLDDFDVNPNAQIVHLLSMTAKNADLAYGKKRHIYDVTVDRLVDVLNVAVSQDAAALGPDLVAAGGRLLATLGMQHSTWPVKSFVISWDASLQDMARLGLLLLNGGVWNGERLVATAFLYNMVHPAFEDEPTLTRYGYLTWLGHKCAPTPVHKRYPHGISEAPDCRLAQGCAQEHDVGVFFAGGLGGQFVVVHRALDLVIVGKNWGEGKIDLLWDAVRPAVVAADPMFKGDDAAFCAAYARGSYAPDLTLWEGGL